MQWASKVINGLLAPFDLRLSRASHFEKLVSKVQRRHAAVVPSRSDNEKRERRNGLHRSQSRWRADEPDAGLTWGVHMSGDEFVRVLREHFTLDDNSVIVEIGPGYGRILDSLLKASAPFCRYIGLEISKARVARLRDHYRDSRVEFREADVLGRVALDAVADVTLSSAVFEHLYPDFSRALETVSRFTRSGGLIMIDFIRDDNDVEKSSAWFDKETYMRTYSTRELKDLFEAGGFAITQAQRISFGQDILNREISRTVVIATKTSAQASTHASTSTTEATAERFDAIVRRPAPVWDPHNVEPPIVPKFRSEFGGLWTDLNTAPSIIAGKLATGAITPAEADLVEAWRRDGFVVLRGAVNGAAIEAALKDFERAYGGELDRRMAYWDDKGHHIVPASYDLVLKKDAKLLNLYDASEATQAIQFAGPVSRFLQIVFERPALAFQSLGFYYGSQQHLHQDTAFVRVNSPMEFVASWIALEDIHEGSGELEYYVGSHAVPQYLFGGKYVWVQPGDPEVERFSEALHTSAKKAGLQMQRFLAKKGDVLIWSAGLMHGGSPVREPARTRKSLVTHYCPADLQPMYAYKGDRPKRKSVGGNYIIAERYE